MVCTIPDLNNHYYSEIIKVSSSTKYITQDFAIEGRPVFHLN